MRIYLILFILLYRNIAISQEGNFPKSWEGIWKGEISIYSGASPGPDPVQIVPMSITIRSIDENRWSWVLSYEAPGQDSRNYELTKNNKGQWVIDEKNGIVLPQMFLGNRMAGSFSVMGSLLVSYYWIDGDALHFEIHSVTQSPVSKTGIDTEESPAVSNHFISAFQKAVLYR